mmetsp:Transcript_54361/g.140050  ORF Transcript_54361/g.140050 Transcript_54361/m.140050 type:complete len:237 (+) Transcript_54361:282-992(+)
MHHGKPLLCVVTGVDDYCVGDGELPKRVQRLEDPHNAEDPVGYAAPLPGLEHHVPVQACDLHATLPQGRVLGHYLPRREQPGKAVQEDQHCQDDDDRVHQRLQQHCRQLRHYLAGGFDAADGDRDSVLAVAAEDGVQGPDRKRDPRAGPRAQPSGVLFEVVHEEVLLVVVPRVHEHACSRGQEDVCHGDQAVDELVEAVPEDEEEYVAYADGRHRNADQEPPALDGAVGSQVELLD